MSDLIPGLPEELALECLTRLHYTTHRDATRVSRQWREIIQSRDFYYHRKKTGHTHRAACLVQSLPTLSGTDGNKPIASVKYAVSVFDPVNGDWDRVDPIPNYPNGLPLFCHVSSSEGKLVVMGGWDPTSYDPVRDVFIYEFTTQQWRRGQQMPDNRSFFAAAEHNGLIFVAGGHDENKNALRSTWVYNVRSDEWTELTRMSQERDECEGLVMDSKFWVISGYRTESQGRFEGSAEFYEAETGEWRRVEDAWTSTKCPRSCVGIGKDGRMFSWAESESAVRVGPCVVDMGNNRTFLSGSTYEGGQHGFFRLEGHNGKLERMEVPNEFSGFVQSGCCVEI